MLLQAHVPVDSGLSVIRAENDRIALEKVVGTSGGIDQGTDGGIAAAECFDRSVGTEHMRRKVVVREVVGEEVEAVPRHEPASHRRCVTVDRSPCASEDRERCSRRIRLEQVVEEETLGAVRRDGQPRQGRKVPRAAAIAGDVDRSSGEARILERLVHRDGVDAEVEAIHVDDRVDDRARHARRTQRRERRAVFDHAIPPAVVPDEVRDPMDVRKCTGRDRGEAHRREGGERGDRA